MKGTRFEQVIAACPADAEESAGPERRPAKEHRRQLIQKITQWWVDEGRALKGKSARSSDVS
jgi:hypothetical protein